MTSRHTSSDGAATSAFARPHACSRTWKPGSAEDYAHIFGGSGRTGPITLKNYAVVACQSSMQRSPLVNLRGSGACPDTRRSNKPCATTISTHSVSPDSMSLPQFNPVEPPWYGPVCPVVGEGRHREVSPYPDHRIVSDPWARAIAGWRDNATPPYGMVPAALAPDGRDAPRCLRAYPARQASAAAAGERMKF